MKPSRRRVPSVDGLEGRILLSATSQSNANRVYRAQHKYHEYVSELQHVELRSHATPEEALALHDAARAISANAATTRLPLSVARSKAVIASLQLDRAPLDGGLGDRGWAEIRSRLASTLDGLNVPPALIDQTVSAMQAIARDAHVTTDEAARLQAKRDSYVVARNAVPNGYANLPDPDVYYTQHLRGFFRGGAVDERAARAKLEGDIRSVVAASQGTPADANLLRRDAKLLEQIGATVDSEANARIADAFVAAFDRGSPDAAAQADLRSSLLAILGPGASRSTLSAVDRLVDDTPAFYVAAGSSRASIRLIADDVVAVVNAGGGALPNLFRVQVGGTAAG